MKHLLRIALAGALTATAGLLIASPNAKSVVLHLSVEGVINPAVSDYLTSGLEEAHTRKVDAVLISLNTPGGLLDATRSAVGAMINSEIPVIVYVGPPGARATSAGVFLMMAADVAAMAPQTHLGAAHPVTIGGDGGTAPAKEDENKKSDGKKNAPGSVMEEKMVSDAAAYIRTLAKEHGRNADWAERAVRESVSLTAEEALKQNVIEFIAATPQDLLKAADGRKLSKAGKDLVLDLADVELVDFDMSPLQRILHLLAHPNVAYILMTIGIYGLIYELSAPGIGLGGAIGGICLLLAFFSLQVLPLNVVGISLLILGVFLFVMELIAPTHGLLTVGGVLAFGLGSFFLIDTGHGIGYPRVSLALILPTVVGMGLFFAFVVRKAWVARRARPKIGSESLLGATGTVREPLAPEGLVFLQGELWNARAASSTVEAGAAVRVVSVEGNLLIVERNGPPEAPSRS